MLCAPFWCSDCWSHRQATWPLSKSHVLTQTNACAALMISDRCQRRSIWDCSHLSTRRHWCCTRTLTQTLSMSAICTTLWSMEWQTEMAVIMSSLSRRSATLCRHYFALPAYLTIVTSETLQINPCAKRTFCMISGPNFGHNLCSLYSCQCVLPCWTQCLLHNALAAQVTKRAPSIVS